MMTPNKGANLNNNKVAIRQYRTVKSVGSKNFGELQAIHQSTNFQ